MKKKEEEENVQRNHTRMPLIMSSKLLILHFDHAVICAPDI
jgi:hypothetical protein